MNYAILNLSESVSDYVQIQTYTEDGVVDFCNDYFDENICHFETAKNILTQNDYIAIPIV